MTLENTPENTDLGGEFDPVEAFLEGWKEEGKEGEKAPAEGDEHAPEETPAESAGEGEEAPAEGEEGQQAAEQPQAKREATDEDEVVVRIGDQDQRISVKDLKALYGKDAELVRTAQAVAEHQQRVEAEAQRYAAGLEKMGKAAADRWREYQNIDWVDARLKMDPAAYQQLRQDATNAFSEHQYFEAELKNHTQAAQQQRHEALVQQARACVAVLKDPEKGIPGWNDALYADIQKFAVEQGADQRVVAQIVDPWAIKALHDAMQYRKGLAAVKTAPKPKPTVPAATSRPNTSREAPAGKQGGAAAQKAAQARLQRSGSLDDAADAFLASFLG